MKQFNFLFVSLALVLAASCASEDDPKPVEGDLQDPQVGADVPANATVQTMGTFTGYAHGLSGKAVLYINDQGERTLRFENFTMSEGPDVYVLFSKTNNYSEANTVAISNLKNGYSNENLNIKVPDSIDLDTHKFVLVYCIQFHSLFGFSELME
jgi:hypothetical protein